MDGDHAEWAKFIAKLFNGICARQWQWDHGYKLTALRDAGGASLHTSQGGYKAKGRIVGRGPPEF